MILPPLQVFLLGAYESFTVELVAACTRLPFPVRLHQMPSGAASQDVQLWKEGAGPAVLLYGDDAETEVLSAPADAPEAPLFVLGPSDAVRQEAWESAGADGYLADADAEALSQALNASYTAAIPEKAASEKTASEKTEPEDVAAAAPMQTRLLSEMSHEIRTPLTTILGFAEVLAQSTEGEEQVLATMIMQGGKRLATIVNSVLDLACVEAGQQPLELERIDVAAEVAEAVSFFVPQAMEKGLSLHVAPPSTPTWAEVDVAMLTRVINNLVGNAVKFTETGHIRVAAKTTDAALTLTVADTGIGMEEAFLPDLFNAFRQGDRAHRQRGSGLGLAITQRLVHLAGGTITVSTEPDQGTTFTVVLPRFSDSPRLPRPVAQGMAGWQHSAPSNEGLAFQPVMAFVPADEYTSVLS